MGPRFFTTENTEYVELFQEVFSVISVRSVVKSFGQRTKLDTPGMYNFVWRFTSVFGRDNGDSLCVRIFSNYFDWRDMGNINSLYPSGIFDKLLPPRCEQDSRIVTKSAPPSLLARRLVRMGRARIRVDGRFCHPVSLKR